MNQALSIRPAARADLPSIVGIVDRVLGEFDVPVDASELEAELEAAMSSESDEHPAGLWVADDGEALFGCVAITPLEQEGVCELKRMYLLPSHRGLGQGRRLLEHALGFAEDKGYQRVELETLTAMEAARALYQRFGFAAQCSTLRNCACDQAMALDLGVTKGHCGE